MRQSAESDLFSSAPFIGIRRHRLLTDGEIKDVKEKEFLIISKFSREEMVDKH